MAYREIVTKTVIAKGKKNYKNNYTITIDEVPSTILGCWIINHRFEAKENNDLITINGSYDVNIWYSYEGDTKTAVISRPITYTEEEKLASPDNTATNKSVSVRALKQPTCLSAKADGKNINLEIEKELGIEIVGEAKVRVSSIDEEDNWQDLDTNSLDNINPNYINEEVIK